MMDRWNTRWENNVERFVELSCVKLILPWSTPSMRFCTSELKTAVICRELVKRFPGQPILSASGIRRAESAKRKLAPIAKPQAKLSSKTHGTSGIDWNPIIEWGHADVFRFLDHRGFALHEAYTKYGASRVSCVYCIMSKEDDLIAASSCTDNHDVYREMAELEIVSTFAFQGSRWLADVAPHLLTDGQRGRLVLAKRAATVRQRAEARIPEHLLYTKGWPTVMPTVEEARLLCDVRGEVADAVGLRILYRDPESLRGRYAALMALKAST
jgi:3'-phosphoadenosine 5'-phosphosulfate sulfotransferase (PAPS reductase)/FAD synthetase